ncbi:hypothetical protein HG531_001100 [Fusarium graminearum]|nr:hypothetical protein HG531_001100 [Fusarium graminearum]
MRPYRDLSLIQYNVFAWADWVEPGTLKPHQVAFEYDSSRSTSKREEYGDRFWLRIIGSTAIRFALHVEASEGLSIVDYSLVRRSAGTCGLDGRAQESLVSFYAGGYKLVQVDMRCNDSMELELVGWVYIEPEDGESFVLTSIDILNKIGHLIEREFDLARRGSVLQQVKLLTLEEC